MHHYDVICFEGLQSATNHLLDVRLIAKMLQRNGFNVAILDVFGLDMKSNEDTIEVIKPFEDVHVIRTNYTRSWTINQIIFQFRMHWYIKQIMRQVVPWADAFYCGSYHDNISSILLRQKKPCMFWGLRSSRFDSFHRMTNENLWTRLRYAYLRFYFLGNPNNYLLYSNDIIKEEFISLGFPQDRLIHREERCVEDNTNQMNASQKLTFLTIGQLRPQKHLELSIAAFKKSNINADFYIVGRNTQEYESVIESLITDVPNIIRVSGYIDNDAFNKYLDHAHFVIFADEKGVSSVTNGTMLEALIHHRPIIAPNYNPYSYYIQKYKVGLLYEYDDINSYVSALENASMLGYQYFEDNITNFLKTISFDSASSRFSNNVRCVLLS